MTTNDGKLALRAGLVAALLVIVSVISAAGTAQPVPGSRTDVDVRESWPATKKPSAAQRAAEQALDGVAVVYDTRVGVPSQVVRYDGYLTKPSKADAEAIARGYLRRHAELFGLDMQDLARLELSREYRTKHNGATHLYFRQTDAGRSVFGSQINVTIDRDGRIATVGGLYYPDAEAAATPKLSAVDAVLKAAGDVGAQSSGPVKPISAAPGRARFENTFAQGIRRPHDVTAELVTFPSPPGEAARLAWRTDIEVDGTGWFESVIDARSGAVLFRENGYVDTGPQGTVFTTQHAGVSGATRSVQLFPAIWVTGTATSGNNVNAYQDLTQTNTVEYQTQTPASPDPGFQHFDYAFANDWALNGPYSLVPAGPGGYVDVDAIITQLFYYTNVLHDWLYGFGFDEASGNFQVDNFGLGGSGGDPVLAEATDGYEDGVVMNCQNQNGNPIRCVNNANFNTPNAGDGNSPRMQMFMWETPQVDGSLDGDVIAHEYGHGVSERLIGNGTLGAGLQAGAMGEGWSDFTSASKWDDPVIGEYVVGNATTGLRFFSMAASPAKYSNLCNVGGSGICEVHNDGEIWAATLWDMRTALVSRYGGSGGAEAYQLVIDGMRSTPLAPSFLNARDGILVADVLTNLAANQCLIWGVFAGREMGLSASSAGSNDMNPSEATDGPAGCTPTAAIGGPYATVEGTYEPLDASGSSTPSDPGFPTTLSYAWDFDNDGQFDDAVGATPSFNRVGQDGVFPISVKVTNGYGFSSVASGSVTVTNLAPSVNLPAIASQPENSPVTASGVVSDPGWLDPLTATIDWGDGSATQPLAGVLENVEPFATLTFSVQHTYGDNGTFTVTVCAADDDTTNNCASRAVTVTNVIPTAVIDESGATLVNGVPTFIAHVGQTLPFSGRSTDPGSDDLTLTWDWDDGAPSPDTSTIYYNNGVSADPFPSPSINPRDVTEAQSHAFGLACLYVIAFRSTDDDGGTTTDNANVIIAGNASLERNAGYWQTQYRPRPTAFSEEQRICYLDIAGFMSLVFNEVRDASTVPNAFDVLSVKQNEGIALQQLDRQLLTAWLNFANGAFEYGELVDTDGNGVGDTAFSVVMTTAESIRLNPASTEAQLYAQRDILQHVNGG